jgi:hypothetical protein
MEGVSQVKVYKEMYDVVNFLVIGLFFPGTIIITLKQIIAVLLNL